MLLKLLWSYVLTLSGSRRLSSICQSGCVDEALQLALLCVRVCLCARVFVCARVCELSTELVSRGRTLPLIIGWVYYAQRRRRNCLDLGARKMHQSGLLNNSTRAHGWGQLVVPPCRLLLMPYLALSVSVVGNCLSSLLPASGVVTVLTLRFCLYPSRPSTSVTTARRQRRTCTNKIMI